MNGVVFDTLLTARTLSLRAASGSMIGESFQASPAPAPVGVQKAAVPFEKYSVTRRFRVAVAWAWAVRGAKVSSQGSDNAIPVPRSHCRRVHLAEAMLAISSRPGIVPRSTRLDGAPIPGPTHALQGHRAGTYAPRRLDILEFTNMMWSMSRSASGESVFQAIASPTRRALLDTLVLGESNVSNLVDSLDVTQSAVSQQLAILKSAGLVEERTAGRFRHYRLRAEPLAEIDAWISRYRACIERQLDALGRVLDAMPDDPMGQRPPSKRKRRAP
jgi:DNA-binding transcriptional ArsR family regulator